MSVPFTPREKEIVQLILDEKSNSVIASELGISERTVESHRKSIYSKSGVNNVVGLVKHVLAEKKSK
ncbi:LuxR C-terminal-related transcriptional regulator [Ekhidna sp.]|uniref:LuxR C-terminal-related transcriptional regulator n=1 Tax=Ekhidna sp. TaxID=2608089 RepID=UPI003B5060E2